MSSCLPACLPGLMLSPFLFHFHAHFLFFLFDFILVFISLKHLESHKNSSHSEIGRERENERVLLTRFIRFYDSLFFLFSFKYLCMILIPLAWLAGWRQKRFHLFILVKLIMNTGKIEKKSNEIQQNKCEKVALKFYMPKQNHSITTKSRGKMSLNC